MTGLRIGVLGAARIAEKSIVRPARELGHQVVAVAARDRDRAEAFARQHAVPRVHASYADVIADPEVDVVYNPLANALHAPWNLAAIRLGKPVLTEKPFARNAAEADEIRRAAQEFGVPIMEGFHYLFHPIMRRMLDLLATGTLGALRRVEVIMRMPEPKPDDPRWRFDLAGGAVMDLGCYGLHVHRQLAAFAGGAPRVTGARAVERAPGVDESMSIDLEFPSGATGSSVNSMVWDRHEMTLRLVGERGEALAHDYLLQFGDDRITLATEAGTTVEHLGTRTTYTYQLEAFASHLRDGAALPIDAGDAVATMRLIDAAYTAAGLTPR